MCGACREHSIIEYAAVRVSDGTLQAVEEPNELWDLQECPNLEAVLVAHARSVESWSRIVALLETLDPPKPYLAPFVVFVCRLMGSLVQHGFVSPIHQRLRAHPVTNLILGYEIHRVRLTEKVLGTPPSPLHLLYEPETLTTEAGWQRLVDDPELIPAAERLVLRYIAPWRDPEADTQGSPQTLLDPESDPVLLLAFLSTRLLIEQAPNSPVLMELVTSNPPAPRFEGLTLWLQRQVVRDLHRLHGLKIFLPYDQVIRPGLLYYLARTRCLTAQEAEMLRAAILASGRYDPHATFRPLPPDLGIEPYLMSCLPSDG